MGGERGGDERKGEGMGGREREKKCAFFGVLWYPQSSSEDWTTHMAEHSLHTVLMKGPLSKHSGLSETFQQQQLLPPLALRPPKPL